MKSEAESVLIVDAETRIKQFLSDQFLFEFDDRITADTDFFKAGLIDSFGYIQFIQFLEKEFAIRFDDDELISYRLNTLGTVVANVEKKLSAS